MGRRVGAFVGLLIGASLVGASLVGASLVGELVGKLSVGLFVSFRHMVRGILADLHTYVSEAKAQDRRKHFIIGTYSVVTLSIQTAPKNRNVC